MKGTGSAVWLGLTLCLSACDRSAGAAAETKPAATSTAANSSKAPGQGAAPSEPVPGAAASAGAPIASAIVPEAPPTDAPPTDAPRVYALTRNVWIRSGPTSETQWLGALWFGGSVRLRGEERVPGAGCGGDWRAVEPRGWVCVDGERATLDPNDAVLRKLYPERPRVETAWPHSYALVERDIPRYEHLLPLPAGAPPSAALELLPASLPKGLSERRNRMVARSAMAYVRSATHGDATLLLAADLSWVRQSDVTPVEPVTFSGVKLEGALHLPLGFASHANGKAFVRRGDGAFDLAPSPFARLSPITLTGKSERVERETYYETTTNDAGGTALWISNGSSVIATPAVKTPWGTTLDEPLPAALTEAAPATSGAPPRHTWLDVSILGGYLVAYEGTRAVYATMISAGRGGRPTPGRDPLETASTPVGRFTVTGKFKTATMESSSTPIVHGDVPWTQNFSGPHAIHSAYWHDDWGNLKSAGCVNVAPIDGKWLFEFTEPSVPDGWHSVRAVSRYGGSTEVVIHE